MSHKIQKHIRKDYTESDGDYTVNYEYKRCKKYKIIILAKM